MKQIDPAQIIAANRDLQAKYTVYLNASEAYNTARAYMAEVASPYEAGDIIQFIRPNAGTKHIGEVEFVAPPREKDSPYPYELAVYAKKKGGEKSKVREYVTQQYVLEGGVSWD